MKARITFENGRKLLHSRPGDVVFLPDNADGLTPINMEIPWLICEFSGRDPAPGVCLSYHTSTQGHRLFAVNLLTGDVRLSMPHPSTICRTATKAILNLRADGD